MKVNIPRQVKKDFYKYANQVFESGYLSDGPQTEKYEEIFSEYVKIPSVAVSSGGAALFVILKYLDVRGYEVILPANTFIATALAVINAGGTPVFVDCNKYDLCISYNSIKQAVTEKTKAVICVHIGGHISFDIEKISKYCKDNNIILIEDCAHSIGASYNKKSAGTWGVGGAYSFYSTKTITTGEGGMISSYNEDLLSYAIEYRNYGKFNQEGYIKYNYKITPSNFRISEITAALGRAMLENMEIILEWKKALAIKYDNIFHDRIQYPEGMQSGYYKYIVFNCKLKNSVGKVYSKSDQCQNIFKVRGEYPNSDWVALNHNCVPIYYGWQYAHKSVDWLSKYLLE